MRDLIGKRIVAVMLDQYGTELLMLDDGALWLPEPGEYDGQLIKFRKLRIDESAGITQLEPLAASRSTSQE